jgi:two-component system CheB/CheR fusion protein
MLNREGLKTVALDSEPTHYIGIGASAGGLEALEILLQHLPTNTGACFVIVQHLSPDFKSMMLELLSKHTSMNIENVEDGTLPKANTIYLLPPKKNIIVAQGELLLADKAPNSGLSLPIDVFFRSLSEDQQYKAIGIILSGTGSDGSRGIKALKEAGALIITQEPQSAKFDGMPNSAINTGIVDFVLRPENIGRQLAKYVQHPLVKGGENALRENLQDSQELMQEIFTILRTHSQVDFSKYKPSTIARRIARRMTIKQATTLQEYLALLMEDEYEVSVLSREFLIGVTRFFRDDEAFGVMKNTIIPTIVAKSSRHKQIRVWVAACSTGEEAYSIAILLHEEIKKLGEPRDIKVFATDVNPDAIAKASAGVFSAEIVHDVPKKLRQEYFDKRDNDTYKVSAHIRNSVVFALHNMIIDPPFSNMNLVTCRNVLIYFQQIVQKRVLTSMHFALNKDAYLFLGSSENLYDLVSHFSVIDERAKIFQKNSNDRLSISAPESGPSPSVTKRLTSIPSISTLKRSYHGNTRANNAIGFANEALITQYVPPCILLDEGYRALHVYGDTSPFIKRVAPGRMSTAISDIVNEDISLAVISALQKAKNSDKPISYTNLKTVDKQHVIDLTLRVTHVKEYDISDTPSYYWLIFEVVGAVEDHNADSIEFDINEQAKKHITALEGEVSYYKEQLQIALEELETSNEELQSSNEELMSAHNALRNVTQ